MRNKLELHKIKGLSKKEIDLIFKETNFRLPNDLKEFLKSYSGGHPVNENIGYHYELIDDDGWDCGDGLEWVFDSLEIIENYNGLKIHLKEHFEHFELDESFVETKYLLPIIKIGSGGCINIAIGGKHNGKIYQVDNGDFGILLISNSLQEFLNEIFLYDYDKDERLN